MQESMDYSTAHASHCDWWHGAQSKDDAVRRLRGFAYFATDLAALTDFDSGRPFRLMAAVAFEGHWLHS